MRRTLPISTALIPVGFTIGLFGLIIWLIHSSWFLQSSDTLSLAITIDLVITIPVFYFLLVRKSRIPRTTVIPVLIIGVVLGSYLLPADNQLYLGFFKTWLLPVVELSILVIVISKVRKTIRQLSKVQNSSPDFFDTVKEVCRELVPKQLIYPIAMEVAVFYYGFVKWSTRDINGSEFTYHKKSGTIPLLIALIFIILAETFVFHFLLIRWSEIAAWILSGLSIYTGIQIFGIAKSMAHRPIRIDEDKLIVRYGIVSGIQIPFSEIESVELSNKSIEGDGRTIRLSFLGEFESHNIILYLKSEQTLIGLYGFKKRFKKLQMHIDNPSDFKKKMDSILS